MNSTESECIDHLDFMELRNMFACPGLNKEDVTNMYAKWSEKYDKLLRTYLPNRPKVCAKEFEKHYGSNKDLKILDVGAGTGLATVELRELGFHNIDALEPCAELAEQAMEKNLYGKWYKAYLCKERLPIDDNVYDVAYAVGVFSHQGPKEDGLEELIRILKPGGQMMIVGGEKFMEDPGMANFLPRISKLEKEGLLICRRTDRVPGYSRYLLENRDMEAIILVLEKPETSL